MIGEHGCLNKTAKSTLLYSQMEDSYRDSQNIRHIVIVNEDTEEWYWGQQFAKLKGTESIMVWPVGGPKYSGLPEPKWSVSFNFLAKFLEFRAEWKAAPIFS